MIDISLLKRDKNYALLRTRAVWPETVLVLSKEAIDDYPFINHPKPASPLEWLEHEHIHPEVIKLWWSHHEKIITYLLSRNEWTGQRRLVYNTVWALLGYIDNQCPDAIQLASRIKRDRTYKHTALNLLGTLT